MSISSDFQARFPEFTGASITNTLPIILTVWPAYYGITYSDTSKEAILNLIAHLIITGERSAVNKQSVSQEEASKAVGNVSVSFMARAGTTQGGGFYNTTPYGQVFWALSRQRSGAVFV